MAPTAEQGKIVYDQWLAVDKHAFMLAIYQNMFAAHPDWRALFTKPTGDVSFSNAEWKKQLDVTRNVLGKALKMAADGHHDELKTELKTMAKRHVRYGVEGDKFQDLKAVLATTARGNVPDVDGEAWCAVGNFICDNIVP